MNTVSDFINSLNPKSVRSNVILLSFYIACYELFKKSVQEHFDMFFHSDMQDSKYIMPEESKKRKRQNRSNFFAALSWLQEMHAIDDLDIDAISQLREYRNSIAHEFINLAFKSSSDELLGNFEHLIFILKKIEKWWIINIEFELNPAFDDMDKSNINVDEIIPGPMILITLLYKIAITSEDEADSFFAELIAAAKKEAAKRPL